MEVTRWKNPLAERCRNHRNRYLWHRYKSLEHALKFIVTGRTRVFFGIPTDVLTKIASVTLAPRESFVEARHVTESTPRRNRTRQSWRETCTHAVIERSSIHLEVRRASRSSINTVAVLPLIGARCNAVIDLIAPHRRFRLFHSTVCGSGQGTRTCGATVRGQTAAIEANFVCDAAGISNRTCVSASLPPRGQGFVCRAGASGAVVCRFCVSAQAPASRMRCRRVGRAQRA
jgi:hypothetical protein